MSTPLAPERWKRLRPLLDQALDLEGAARDAFLDVLAQREPELLPDLRRMLAHNDRTTGIDATQLNQAVGAMRSSFLSAAAAPKRAGPWRLEERVGEGGMGEVWRAHRVEGGFEQIAALKVIRAGVDSDQLRARFELERRIVARLEHPSIARLLDGGVTDDGRPYFAMEFIDGEPINRWAERTRPGIDAILRLFVEICGAVEFANRNLVVHRDLKPSNILIDQSGRAKLLDFGIAKLLDEEADGSATQLRALTPAYAAPEQFDGSAITTATDVYALGLILYEIIAGELPAERKTGPGIAALATVEVNTGPVRRCAERSESLAPQWRTLGRDLDAIVLTALRRDPARRYPSAAALADDLRRLLDGLPVSARPDSLGYRMRRFVGRHRSAVAAGVLAVVALLTGLGVALWQAQVAQQLAARLQEEVVRAAAESRRAEVARDFLLELVEAGNPNQVGGDVRRTVREMLLSAGEKLDARLGDQPLVQAELRLAVARALRAHGEPGAARELVETSLAQLDDGNPAHTVLLGSGLQIRASLQAEVGEFAAAETDVTRALALFDQAANQPGVSDARRAALSTLGIIYGATGREPAALDLRREDLLERSRELGEQHPELAPAWYNLGVSNFRAERFDEALTAFERAESIMAAAESDQAASPRRLFVWLMLAQTQAMQGRFEQAAAWLQRGGEMLGSDLARERPDLETWLLSARMSVAWAAARLDDAIELGETVWPRLQNDPRTDIAPFGVHWSAILLAGSRPADAEAVARRALEHALKSRGDEDPFVRQLRAAILVAGYRQHQQPHDLNALVELAETMRAAGPRRPYGQVAAWLAQDLESSDPAAAARWGAEADTALSAVHGQKHPWARSRAGTRETD